MALPLYDPAGTQRTQAVNPLQTSGDTFGAGVGRAMDYVGKNISATGGAMMELEKKEREKDDATDAIRASTEAQSQMREKLYGEGGILEQKGANASGAALKARQAADEVIANVRQNIGSPEAQDAFDKMMFQYNNTLQNSVTNFEFDQRQATRTAEKTSALSNIQADVVTHYADEEMLKTNFDQARRIIRANPDGLPAESVQQLEREAVSSLHLQVIQRMALDNPAMAMDYYNRNKGEVSGVDHTQADKMIGQISRIRDVQDGVQQIINSGPAGAIVGAVMGAESSFNVNTPPSSAGALGLMQLMPDTARETALAVGLPMVARMTDDELKTYFRTPEGARANVRIGTAYLGKQLQNFNGDVEASLIAYNAGPANATKWLNAGRDYSVLPKASETQPYVAKVISAWKGVDIPQGAGSKEIQAAVKGSQSRYYQGDSKAFLLGKLQKQHGKEHIDGMSNEMSDRLAALFSEAPDFVKDGLDILSGTRTKERQKELWDAELRRQGGDVAKARKNVAPPEGEHGSKGSNHNHGNAGDLGWKGGKFATAPREVVEWVHANAGRYGLNFPLANEPWHIEPDGVRGGRVGRMTPDERIDMAFGVANSDNYGGGDAGSFQMQAQTTSAADLYSKANEPFTVRFDAPDPEVWLAQARERFADDPAKLAEAERQIEIESKRITAATKADVDNIKKDVLRNIMNGGSVKDYDQDQLQKIGHEAISGLMNFETNWKTDNAGKTDPQTYLELTSMSPADFANVDLMDYIGKLGLEDFKKFANTQAEYTRDGAGKMSAGRTRNEIVSDAQKILGLELSGKRMSQDDVARSVALNRAVDGKIQEFIDTNKKQPNGVELQKIVDDLIVKGKVTDNIFLPDTKRYAFELSDEERITFAPAQVIDDVPPEAKAKIAPAFKKMWGVNPNETAAVNFYNDVVRVNLGGAPMPPKDLMPKIRQGLMQKLRRPPSDDEVAAFYRKWMLATLESK